MGDLLEGDIVSKPVLNSMLLGSTDAERLKNWYRDGFHAETDGYGNLNLGGFGLVIEQRDDVTTKTVEPGRHIVNFAVDTSRRPPLTCARSTSTGSCTRRTAG